MTALTEPVEPVWYLAYGSNLWRDRFLCYVTGGRPPGASRTYPGCRDTTPPAADAAMVVGGRIAFGGESTVWGGGIAYLDPAADGVVAARAYLLSSSQLNDVVCQETRQPPGTDLALGRGGRRIGRLPSPRGYDTVAHLGERDGHPLLTITSHQSRTPTAPSPSYLRAISRGLHEAHGWDAIRIADYLLLAAGVAGAWTRRELASLLVQRG